MPDASPGDGTSVSDTNPFTLTFTMLLMPRDQELMEYTCEENNQDANVINGPAAPATAK